MSKDQIWTAGFTSEDVSDLGEGVSSGMHEAKLDFRGSREELGDRKSRYWE